ncbi:RNA polymerase-binding protein DksA [Tepidicella xavieri]|uniref:RNA polymerase-binding protein DksA n=1 Tax=Tepidicella xavieri TaxID=360241 RepID=UPI003CCC57EC
MAQAGSITAALRPSERSIVVKDTAKSSSAAPRGAAGKSASRPTQAAGAKAAPVKTAAAPAPRPEKDQATPTLSTPERDMTPISSAPPSKKDPKLANNWKTKPVEELTDADVLAMPDSEYMNEVQLAYFRRKLEQLKRDILINAGETTEHLREETVVVPDPADRATIEEEHALELRTRDRERKLLKKIEQSIARIDSGDYGYCDETGEPIGVGRLLARPTASLSIEAQQRRELKQKLFGD